MMRQIQLIAKCSISSYAVCFFKKNFWDGVFNSYNKVYIQK